MIVLVAGVAGSGKSTLGRLLADHLHWPFADADDFHPRANIEKMAAGIPLSDADREPWLRRIAAWMDERITAGEPAIAGCSALRRAFRDELLGGRPAARLVFLTISRDVAHARLAARRGHFFSARLMDSQFAELEPPEPDEEQDGRILVMDASAEPGQLAAGVIGRLGLRPAGQP